MNTIKIYLAESGRVADLKKDFPLYQYQYQNKLLNVFVPTSILAPNFISQNTNGEVLKDYVGSTSVKIGMYYTARDGSIKISKNYYMKYLKTFTYQNVEYALYERKLPKEFTLYVGQGANAPIVVLNIVNILQDTENDTPIILDKTPTQTCSLDVMDSKDLENDEEIEPSELENINAQINAINEILPTKQNKTDDNLKTTNKSVVEAINENKSRIDTNTTNIDTNTEDIAKNRNDIDFLIAKMKLTEDYIGQLSGTELPTNSELNAFVIANTSPSREPRNGDIIIFIQQIEGATDKNYKYFYSDMGWQYYEIPPMEPASNGSLGLLQGTYSIGSTNDILVDISGGEILNIYVKDNNGTYRNIVEYFSSTTTSSEEIKNQLNSIEDAVAMLDSDVSLLGTSVSNLETADTQNVKITGDQVINGIKNFIGTLQINGENIKNVIGDLAIGQQIELGADGIIESNNITYTVQNAEDYLPYRTNLRNFILNLHLPVVGEITPTFPINITFGDTTYYLYDIIDNSRITWENLSNNTSQSAEGFSTIVEATLFITSDLVGFYIILPALQKNIDAEKTARENADIVLQNNIDSEASTRAKADTDLKNNIDSEASIRESTDNDLQNQINELEASKASKADLDTANNNINNINNNINNIDSDINTINNNIKTISSKIPEEASSTNKLADKAFVNTSSQSATTQANSYTDTTINNLIGGAPEAFDTLKEIADWIANDEQGTSALINRVSDCETNISNLENNKVDKIEGKGLSTNDFTTQEKNKLASLSNYDDTAIKNAITNLETNKANKTDPISQFAQDSTHRTVTDEEKIKWNAKTTISYSNITIGEQTIIEGVATFE